jgi:hypothetical protein
MGNFNNPWGKGSDGHDRWFKNPWRHDNDSVVLDDDLIPSIDHWEIKNSGSTSPDNKCLLAKVGKATKLGLDCDPRGWSNGIELKAFILNHKEGFFYEIRRTKIWVIWEKVGDEWKLTSPEPELASDDGGNTDEYLIPQETDPKGMHYIYSMDRPMISGPRFWTTGASVLVYTLQFEESVIIYSKDKSVDDPMTQSWYCRIYLNVTEEKRTMNFDKSYIGAGTISLEKPTD